MTPQLGWLGAALVLAIVQIMVAAGFKRQQDGLQWAAGARDNPPSYTGVAARMDRAEKNLFETLWIFAIALLVAHVAGRDGALNLWGARVYVLARIVYVPLYGAGVRTWRSVAWGAAMVGLVLTLLPIL
jgi:uncharacterized MAPEG superfamily protein